MASKKRRKKSRPARKPAPTADQAVSQEASQGKSPDSTGPKKPPSRISAAIDRMEQATDDRPPAPWGNFPLGPLSVLAGLIFIGIGALGSNPKQLGIGVALGGLGGLELSIREHFAGFRSHTTLLAGFLFVITVGVAYYVATIVLWACLLIGLAVAVPVFFWLRHLFEKASGGLTYKIR